MKISIINLVVTPFSQNCRIIFNPQTKQALVIDPGGDLDQIFATIKNYQLNVEAVCLTHAHLDHAGGVMGFLKAFPVKLYAHREDRLLRQAIQASAVRYGFSAQDYQNCREPDVYLEDLDQLEWIGTEWQVLFTPGHAPGHICLYHQASNLLIAGDTVFNGSIGRTDLPGGNFELLISSIRNKILTLPDQTKILCGHGPDSTVGSERQSNPFLK